MNITASTLFPGIDGIGRSLAENINLRIHHGKRLLYVNYNK
jgi:hypothetical protein